MNRYAFIRINYSKPFPKVLQILESEEMPTTYPEGASGIWVDVTGNTTVQVGWKALNLTGEWIFSEPTYQDYVDEITRHMESLLSEAVSWLRLNPLQYKVDLGVATPADEALLLAYKQYYIAVSEVKNQSGYPHSVNWPAAPF
ncbi:Caudovirales tail fiber assembly protein [Pseudomonas chlororaphis subsp. aurantiaca]|uniref:tail fiber assembly protein n=1 Tax=Pseudomonas chlororaphis TaxID=587753 RepID=UPI00050D3202|nr:tail fiber assembly protein [Pseudomonas chlororaphis]AIS14658.1 Caudovirales tail fiber assembly protein [Pseudomonas chlororaphis subsp. aurantiaca]